MTLIYPFEEEQGKPKFDARKIFPVPIEYQETPAVITVFQLERRGEPGSKIIGVLNSHDLEPHVIWETSWGDFASLVAAVPYDDAPGCIVIYSKTEISLGIPPVTTYYAENIHPADPFTGGADFLNRTWPGRPEPSLYTPLTAGGHIRSGSGIVVLAERKRTVEDPDQEEQAIVALRLNSSGWVTNEVVLFSSMFPLSTAGLPPIAVTPVAEGAAGWAVLVGNGQATSLFYVGPPTSIGAPTFTSVGPFVVNTPSLAGVPASLTTMTGLRIAGGPRAVDTSRPATVNPTLELMIAGIANVLTPGVSPLPVTSQTFCLRVTLSLGRFGASFPMVPDQVVWNAPRSAMVSVVQVIDDPNTRSHWHVAEYQIGGLGTAVVLPNKIRHTGFHGVAYDHFDGFYGPELALAFQWRSVPRSPAGHGIFAWSSPSDVDITRGVNIAYWNHDSWLHVFRTADPAHAEVLPSMIWTGPTVFRASAPLAGNNFFEVQLLGSDPNRRVFLVVSSKWLHPAGTGGVVVDGTVPGAVSIPVMTDGSGNARQTLELSGDSGALLAPLFNTAGAIVNGERFAFPRILFAQWIWNDLLPLGSPIDSPLEEFDFLDTVLVTHASNALILLIGDR